MSQIDESLLKFFAEMWYDARCKIAQLEKKQVDFSNVSRKIVNELMISLFDKVGFTDCDKKLKNEIIIEWEDIVTQNLKSELKI